jgi:hypothetical protein
MNPQVSPGESLTAAPAPSAVGFDPLLPAPPEYLPDLDSIVIEDGQPMDSVFFEKLCRLLTEALYSCWPGPGEGRTFEVFANVGLFYAEKKPALAPDVMLSLGVKLGDDFNRKENRSYFVWILGKPPDVVIEFVSDRRGGEAGYQMRQYASLGVVYYVIFDPQNRLGQGILRAFALREGEYEPIEPGWLPKVGLGLTLWEGEFEGHRGRWLRWCRQDGQVIPTARERVEQLEEQARRLEARLREAGLDPSA